MGTNIYLKADKTPNYILKKLHVGKCSGGWVFALQVISEQGLNTLNDWIAFSKHISPDMDYPIFENEYGNLLSLNDLLDTIYNRKHPIDWKDKNWDFDKSETQFHFNNHSVRGPNNLLRSKVDGSHCIGHDGMCDLIDGNFS